MRYLLAILFVGLSSVSSLAATDCTKEANEALDKQRATGKYRMKSSMISERGLVQMTVDYELPGRMHQKMKVLPSPVVSETLLVDGKAWVKRDGDWNALAPIDAEELANNLKKNVEQKSNQFLAYFCEGKTKLDGADVLVYRVKEAKKKVIPGATPKSPPTRFLYVDAKTGLPERTTVAAPNRLDQPFFKAIYSYPSEIAIKPPVPESQ